MLVKILKVLVATTLIVVLVIAGVAWWAWRAVNTTQPWYEEIVLVEPATAAEASRQCERQVTVARERLQDGLPWEMVFTQDQINGWLAHEAKQHSADGILEVFQNPRVSITPDQIRIGGRYLGSGMNTVLSLTCKVSLTDNTNVAAVHIDGVSAGQLAIPRERAIDRLKRETKNHPLPVIWEEEDGHQFAHLFIPDKIANDLGPVTIDTLEILEGKIRIAGRSRRMAAEGS